MQPLPFFRIRLRALVLVFVLVAMVTAVAIVFGNNAAYWTVMIISGIVALALNIYKDEPLPRDIDVLWTLIWILVFSSIGAGINEAVISDSVSAAVTVFGKCLGFGALGAFIAAILARFIIGIRRELLKFLGTEKE